MKIIKSLKRNNACIIFIDDDKNLSSTLIFENHLIPHVEYLIVKCGENKYYYKEGKLHQYSLHRNNKPAEMSSSRVSYWKNGFVHREDGPAIIYKSRVAYYLNGQYIKTIYHVIKITKKNKLQME